MGNGRKQIGCRIDENRHINCADCPYYTDDDKGQMWCSNEINNDALELLKQQNGLMLALEQSNASNEYYDKSVSELGETINILKDEIKRLKAELNQYHKADTFLAVHGWQWKKTTTESSTNPKDGEPDG